MEDALTPNAKVAYTLGDIARRVNARIKGNPDRLIGGVAPLEAAGPEHVSFVSHPRSHALAEQSGAAALIVDDSLGHLERDLLICAHPYLAFARTAQLFAEPPRLPGGIHPLAFVGADAELGEGVAVGAFAHIGEGCAIGRGTRIYGGVYLGHGVRVGAGCILHPRATVLDGCIIGDRVTLHSGAVVGSDGFGFAQDERGRHVKIPQMGVVQIDDDVEIGANCTIDRATMGKTWVQRGVKIDNQVQIAHNVTVGEHSLLVSQAGVAGSTQLGKHVVLAGQSGVGGHISLGDRVRLAAQSGVSHSVAAGIDLMGSPALPAREWVRLYGTMRRLPQMREELKALKERLDTLERDLQGKGHD
jgi:UDP-3-O-[3-hydroxymyristoyl] glucosamine N-acyltransferase